MREILHEYLHFIVSAGLFMLFMHKFAKQRYSCVLILLLGGILGIAVDIPKELGYTVFHAIWLAPVIGLVYGWLVKMIFRELSLLKSWLFTTLTLVFGHLLIDVFGDGNNLFAPFSDREVDFSILNAANEKWLYILATAAVLLYLVLRTRPVLTAGIAVMAAFVIALSISHESLVLTLEHTYSEDHPQSITVFPAPSGKLFHWNYYVRISDLEIISGEAKLLVTSEQQVTTFSGGN